MASKTSATRPPSPTSPKLADVMSPEIEELFAQVYANPDDESARLVLSDALIELRNPRGEFIAMQFGRASGRAVQEQKERKLLHRFQDRWIKPFGDCVQRPVFERGFLARCTLVPEKLTSALIGAREWSTVHTIDFGQGGDLTPFLLSDPIRSWTRRLHNVQAVNAAPALLSPLVRRWRSIQIFRGSAKVAVAMATCTKETMPELTKFEVSGEMDRLSVEQMILAPIAGQLDELSIVDRESNRVFTGIAPIKDLLAAPERPKRISVACAAGSIKIDLRGELEGQIEIGLLRYPLSIAQTLEVLKGAPIKAIRILEARDSYYSGSRGREREIEIKQLRAAAEKIAPVKLELIP